MTGIVTNVDRGYSIRRPSISPRAESSDDFRMGLRSSCLTPQIPFRQDVRRKQPGPPR
jgi:hypothetical protein